MLESSRDRIFPTKCFFFKGRLSYNLFSIQIWKSRGDFPLFDSLGEFA